MSCFNHEVSYLSLSLHTEETVDSCGVNNIGISLIKFGLQKGDLHVQALRLMSVYFRLFVVVCSEFCDWICLHKNDL